MNKFITATNVTACFLFFVTVFFTVASSLNLLADETSQSPAARVYVQFLEEKIGLHSPAERVKFWIGQLESVLQDAQEADYSAALFYHVTFSLADLHMLINDKHVAEKLFSHVFSSEKAPKELRITAGNNLLASGRFQASYTSPEYNIFFTQFEELINGLSEQVGKKYIADLQRNRILHADLPVEMVKKKITCVEQSENDETVFITMYDAYIEASQLLSKFIDDFPLLDQNQKSNLLHLNFGIDSALFRLGQIKYQLGLLSLKRGKQQDAMLQFDSAIGILTVLLKEHGEYSLFAARAFVMILNIEDAKDNTDGKQLLFRLKEMMPYIQNVRAGLHTIHNCLLDKAMAMSKEGTRSIAADIYSVLIEREKKYFPNEYESHINYQIGLASQASNYAEIGDIKKMQQSIEKLKQCSIEDPETSKLIQSLIESAKERIEFTQFAFDPHSHGSGRGQYLVLRIFFVIAGIVMIVVGLYLAWTKEKKRI